MSRDPFLDETLVCAVTATPRPDPEQNEDAAETIHAPRFGLCGVAVADGLGSFTRARPAARHAAAEAAAWLRDQAEDFGRGALGRLFAHVHAGLRARAREMEGGDPGPGTFGTTLLVGLEAGADLVAAYAGNGAIWHLRGNLEANPSTGVAWNAVNLLNPHSVFRDGREVLYTLVDAADEDPPVPTLVSVRKDPRFGDILLLCTDGIYSADQVTHGLDAAGAVWLSAEAPMVAFHHALRELFAAWDGESDLPLHDALRAFLNDLRDRRVLEDDATVGVIITADALRHQREARAERIARAGAAPSSSAPEPADRDPAADERAGRSARSDGGWEIDGRGAAGEGDRGSGADEGGEIDRRNETDGDADCVVTTGAGEEGKCAADSASAGSAA